MDPFLSVATWPYPNIIAHRGGGCLAPENTLVAIETAYRCGQRMVEFDVKLSRDGQIFLLHDETLQRTSNGQGIAGDLIWQELQQLDAGSWFAADFYGEPIPLLSQVAQCCNKWRLAVNIEIKPTKGMDIITGQRVAQFAEHLWQHQALAPLLSSFSLPALQAARQAAPQLPLGLLLEKWDEQWQSWTKMLGCFAVHLHHRALTAKRVAMLKAADLHVLAYTVNSPKRVEKLLDWGVDAIFTDRIDMIGGHSPNR